jgi:hypothetical protein
MMTSGKICNKQLTPKQMFDQIINFAKEQLGDKLKSDHGLDDNQHNEVFSTAQSSVMDTIKSQAMSGNLSGIMNLFNGKESADHGTNAIAGEAHSSVISGLMDKFGFDSDKAGGIASQIIPSIMNRFSSPETGTADDAGDLMKKIGMDGDSGIMDTISKFTGGGEGGLMDKVKGLFS